MEAVPEEDNWWGAKGGWAVMWKKRRNRRSREIPVAGDWRKGRRRRAGGTQTLPEGEPLWGCPPPRF